MVDGQRPPPTDVLFRVFSGDVTREVTVAVESTWSVSRLKDLGRCSRWTGSTNMDSKSVKRMTVCLRSGIQLLRSGLKLGHRGLVMWLVMCWVCLTKGDGQVLRCWKWHGG